MTPRHLRINSYIGSEVGVNCGSARELDMFNLRLDFTLKMLKQRQRSASAEDAAALIEHFL